jgi:hypothetical protein
MYAPEKDRPELSDDLYEQLQNFYGKVNKNDYILMLGDMNM